MKARSCSTNTGCWHAGSLCPSAHCCPTHSRANLFTLPGGMRDTSNPCPPRVMQHTVGWCRGGKTTVQSLHLNEELSCEGFLVPQLAQTRHQDKHPTMCGVPYWTPLKGKYCSWPCRSIWSLWALSPCLALTRLSSQLCPHFQRHLLYIRTNLYLQSSSTGYMNITPREGSFPSSGHGSSR